MRVIVAGGREVTDPALVAKAIEASGFEITELVSGGARGVDALGEAWALAHGLPVRIFRADWKKHGRKAGPLRNREMAAYAEALIAIPTGGPGTQNMIKEAWLAKRPQYIHTTDLVGELDALSRALEASR